jgi:anti-anti-sigma factor
MDPEYRGFDVRFEGDVPVLQLLDPRCYDTEDYADLQGELLRHAEDTHPAKVVVDFAKVQYCSTAVINGLIQLRKRLAQHGGQVKLSGLSSEVRQAFRHLHLEPAVFDIYDTAGAAVAAS